MPKYKIVSEYFSAETVMDESLSDFQRKKKYNTGPKNVKRATNGKKQLKHAKGQKDIRALIKKKENEVVSFSKDFNKVCKQTGVDVDSEQLQLAIALSKSLHEVQSSSEPKSKNTKLLTSLQRTLKIKATLQEYGFKTNKTRQLITCNDRKKRQKKQYKLLLISQTERQQIISDKYAEVLARNIFRSPVKGKVSEQNDYYDKELYYKTTNITYECIKNDDVYYVKDLFPKSYNKICLLRDWSEIPGRPLSPTVEDSDVNFDDVTCNQHDLDCLLSGTIFTAQQIISNKNNADAHNNSIDVKIRSKGVQLECEESNLNVNNVRNNDCISLIASNVMETDCNMGTMLVSQHTRCTSPDLFEDEISLMSDCSRKGKLLSEQTVLKNDNNLTYYMDLTRCVDIESYSSDKHAQINNASNLTNGKSKDHMEITKCVSTIAQATFENIDLTQNLNDSNKKFDKILSQNDKTDIMDLTQTPDNYILMGINCRTTKHSHENRISVLDDNGFNLKHPQQQEKYLQKPIDKNNMKNQENSDYNNCDDDNFRNCSFNSSSKHNENGKRCLNKSCEIIKTIVLDDESNFNVNSKENLYLPGHKCVMFDVSLDKLEDNSSSEKLNKLNQQTPTHSITYHTFSNSYDANCEYIRHSLTNTGQIELSKKLTNCQSDKMDLTQSSISSKGDSNYNKLTNEPTSNHFHSLGKRDEISIDYDEIFDDIVRDSKSQTTLKSVGCDISNLTEKESNNLNITQTSNPSKSFEEFDISDKEFNYSLHEGNHENADFRDISLHNYSHIKNKSVRESTFLKQNIVSPIQDCKRVAKENIKNVIQTPKNGEYLIKTNEVTPMPDYTSMSSPEREKELDKFGLKPFKRKRAIQLLTYLYDQTHPLIESHDSCPSPSKRAKTSYDSKIITDSKRAFPSSKPSLDSVPAINEESDLYAATKGQPDITNIKCDVEDWVFQKREKTKVHSTRVPLHITFHNYISCRQRLREAILRYEPVNIDIIHKGLVESGYRYNPKDLLKFMDKKCITVKTAGNNSRNGKS